MGASLELGVYHYVLDGNRVNRCILLYNALLAHHIFKNSIHIFSKQILIIIIQIETGTTLTIIILIQILLNLILDPNNLIRFLVSALPRHFRREAIHTLHFVACTSFLLNVAVEVALQSEGNVEATGILVVEDLAFLCLN